MSVDSPTNSAWLSDPEPRRGGGDGKPQGLLLSQIRTQPAFPDAVSGQDVEVAISSVVQALPPSESLGAVLELSPGIVRLRPAPHQRSGGGSRGPVKGFSAASRRGLLAALGTLDLSPLCGVALLITLSIFFTQKVHAQCDTQ